MPTLSDARFDALRGQGFTGSTSDMVLAWLQSGPFGVPVAPVENLYQNPEFAGGGLNTPPQGHTVQVGTTEYDFVGPLFRSNPNGETGRAPLQYALQTKGPLNVGDIYYFTVLINNLSPTEYDEALAIITQSNITILESQFAAPGNSSAVLCFVRFTVDDPTFTMNIRYGNGTRGDASFQIEATDPRLINETERKLLLPRTIPDAWKAALPPPPAPVYALRSAFNSPKALNPYTLIREGTVSLVNDRLRVGTNGGNTAPSGAGVRTFQVESGKEYTAIVPHSGTPGTTGDLRIGSTSGGSEWLRLNTLDPAGGVAEGTFTATADTGFISLWTNLPDPAEYMEYDSITIQESLVENQDPSRYQRNDWWYEYLGSLGYTGSLNDRELAFWLAGGTPPP